MIDARREGVGFVRLILMVTFLGILLGTGCARAPDVHSQDDTATRPRLAQLAEPGGDAKEELAFLALAATHAPDNLALQARYANALAAAGRNKDALDVALPAYGRDKNNTQVGLLIGRLYVRLDNGPAAAAIYRDIGARDGNNLEAINGLGIANVVRRMLPDAEADFRRAVAAAPTDAASRNNLALALTLEHKTDEALRVLETLWHEDATSRSVRNNLALAYTTAGNRDKAVALLTPVAGAAEAERTVGAYAQPASSTP